MTHETEPLAVIAHRLDAAVAFQRTAAAYLRAAQVRRERDRQRVEALLRENRCLATRTGALAVEVREVLAEVEDAAGPFCAEQFARALAGHSDARQAWQLLADEGIDLAVRVVDLLARLDDLAANVSEHLDATVAVVSLPAAVEASSPEPRRLLLGSLTRCAP